MHIFEVDMRHTIWTKVRSKLPEGCLLPWWALAVKAVLYPLDFIRWRMRQTCGYQWHTDTWLPPTAGTAGTVKSTVRPKTHNYTLRTWGHDFSTPEVIDGGMRLRIAGFGTGIKAGDYLILPNGSGTTRYRVEQITYSRDPPDMWLAEAVFAPRQAVSAAQAST